MQPCNRAVWYHFCSVAPVRPGGCHAEPWFDFGAGLRVGAPEGACGVAPGGRCGRRRLCSVWPADRAGFALGFGPYGGSAWVHGPGAHEVQPAGRRSPREPGAVGGSACDAVGVVSDAETEEPRVRAASRLRHAGPPARWGGRVGCCGYRTGAQADRRRARAARVAGEGPAGR